MSTRSILSRSTFTSLAFLAATAVTGSAKAVVLNFDDIAIADPLWEEQVSSYGGFQWGNTYAIDAAGYGAGTGYENAAVSGNNVVLNGWGDVSSTTSGGTFTFNGAYITSAFRNDMGVTISGFRGGVMIGSVSTTVNTSTPNWVMANFEGIDTVSFSTFGGVVVVDSPDFEEGTQFGLDNFTINEPVAATAVPELDAKGVAPAITLLACALAMIAGQGRRRRIGR